MAKKAVFLLRQGERKANPSFLLEYKRCILLELEREGVLSREHVEACIAQLEKVDSEV